MGWNWQQADWPHFTHDSEALRDLEAAFQHRSGVLQGALKHLSEDDRSQLTIDLISEEAVKTSEIEGALLNRDSVQSSISRQFGFRSDTRRVPPAEQGVADMMVDLYRTFDQRLTHKRLYEWHTMLMNGQRGIATGAYRKHEEPMRILSGPIHNPRIHYEAPPSARIKAEMADYVAWFNETDPSGEHPLPPLTRTGVAHLYFECIHPFEDGNGRIGRAIAEKALSQALGRPTLVALSQEIDANKKRYYQALEDNNKDLEITDWLTSFAETILSAQERSQRLVEFLIEKTKLYDRLRGMLNDRQSKALERMFREGPDGFTGGLSAENYITITKTSRATATRDLQDLVAKQGLIRTGERRHTRYWLNIASNTGEP